MGFLAQHGESQIQHNFLTQENAREVLNLRSKPLR